MADKMDYLKKYHKDVQIIESGFDNIADIPDSWKRVLNLQRAEDKVIVAMQMWNRVVFKELSNTIQYMKKNLKNIELITYRGRYSLLYSIASENGQILYYEGGNPLQCQPSSDLERYWTSFPDTVQKFYQDLHDGFHYYASGSMGLYSKSDILYLGDEDWEIVEKMEESLKIQLESSFGFFGSGAGAYVVIDALNDKDDDAVLWSVFKLPRYNINFWDIVDEWIVIGFQG